MVLAFITLLRTAWISDDAAITLRAVLNLLQGFGPNSNIYERVQGYTHPLWFLLLSLFSLFFGNVFYVTFFTSIFLTLATIYVLYKKVSISTTHALLGTLALLLSKAFVDFSTSGLENPFSHFIIVVGFYFCIRALENSTFQLPAFLMLGLLPLCRHDLILVSLPAIAYVWLKTRHNPKTIKNLLISTLPIIAWTIFSTIYYGFPFPNTAYAKLFLNIPSNEIQAQGLSYFTDVCNRDPITAMLIFVGLALGIYQKNILRAFSISLLLYLLYIISIGGDFMSGRFFTVPLIIAVIVICRLNLNTIQRCALIALILGLGYLNLNKTILSDRNYNVQRISYHGISDERGYYFQQYGMLPIKNIFSKEFQKPQQGAIVLGCGNDGYRSIIEGVFVINTCALTDPLLARIPAFYLLEWRPGHFFRRVPKGYVESIRNNANLIVDPDMRLYYENIREITRAPIFSKSRLIKVARMNLGLIKKPNFDFFMTAPPLVVIQKSPLIMSFKDE